MNDVIIMGFWDDKIIASVILNNLETTDRKVETIEDIITQYLTTDKCRQENPSQDHPYGATVVYFQNFKMIIDNITLKWETVADPSQEKAFRPDNPNNPNNPQNIIL